LLSLIHEIYPFRLLNIYQLQKQKLLQKGQSRNCSSQTNVLTDTNFSIFQFQSLNTIFSSSTSSIV